jgi:hypothetical protein
MQLRKKRSSVFVGKLQHALKHNKLDTHISNAHDVHTDTALRLAFGSAWKLVQVQRSWAPQALKPETQNRGPDHAAAGLTSTPTLHPPEAFAGVTDASHPVHPHTSRSRISAAAPLNYCTYMQQLGCLQLLLQPVLLFKAVDAGRVGVAAPVAGSTAAAGRHQAGASLLAAV